MKEKIIVWFRQDLRIHDNPALEYALKSGNIIPIFILDDNFDEMGGASKWWLNHSLQSLSDSFKNYGIEFFLFKGDPKKIIFNIINETKAKFVVWNRCYEPFLVQQDEEIKNLINQLGIEVKSFNASLLFEPWEIRNQSGDFFKVFTPFWKYCLTQPVNITCDSTGCLKKYNHVLEKIEGSVDIKNLNLLPKNPDWSSMFHWKVGELAALEKFDNFILSSIYKYKELRDFPDKDLTSKLSPHLHFGEISPRLIYHKCQILLNSQEDKLGINSFLSELGWREFSYHLLYNFPNLPDIPFKTEFQNFKWNNESENFKLWKKGQTGFPLIDAAMKELWKTGYMHNRLRMIVASFLTKNLLINWRDGAKWFQDTLVDFDLANNSASWQWVAGCGFDAAPYFRIFNPLIQSEKFDPNGIYIKKWLPELAKLDIPYIHKPWTASPAILKTAEIDLGKNYPYPIIDFYETRKKALELYSEIK